MNYFKRWASAVSASFEWLLSQMENHEALISLSLREMQAAEQAAGEQLQQLESQTHGIQAQVKKLSEFSDLLTQQARVSEDQKALILLLRRRDLAKEQEVLKTRLEELSTLRDDLKKDLESLHLQISSLIQRREELSSRQLRSHYQSSISKLSGISDVDDLFHRWESQIAHYERAQEHSTGPPGPHYHREIKDGELRRSLMNELLEIRKEQVR